MSSFIRNPQSISDLRLCRECDDAGLLPDGTRCGHSEVVARRNERGVAHCREVLARVAAKRPAEVQR